MKQLKHVPVFLFLLTLCFIPVSAESTSSEETIVFDVLTITPNHVSVDENVTLLFKITNNENRDELVGFIIEHHPPPYLIVDNENMTLKYYQYAKSTTIPAGKTITYVYRLSSEYPGVNTIVVTHEGSPVLTGTFTVSEKRISNFMGEPEKVTFSITTLNYYPMITASALTVATIAYILFRFNHSIQK